MITKQLFYSIFRPVEPEDILQQNVLSNLQQGRCPLKPNENISGRHFALVGRSAITNTKYSPTITLGVKTTHSLAIQGGYVPISELAFHKLKRSARIRSILNNLSYAFIGFCIVSLVVWWIWKFSIPGILHIPSWSLVMLFLPCVIILSLSNMFAQHEEKRLNRKTITVTKELSRIGVPDYNNKLFKLILETDSIESSIQEVRKKEARLK